MVEEGIDCFNRKDSYARKDKICLLFENINDKAIDYNTLKITLEELKENDKNEVIESIRIKIDNEEQENRFNNLLKLLF
jgi:hypothetical protein